MELAQEPVRSEIVSGQSISVSPVVKYMGIRDAIAFVKSEMPTYGSGSPAYSFNLNSNWTKVTDEGLTVVYGYNELLTPDTETYIASFGYYG